MILSRKASYRSVAALTPVRSIQDDHDLQPLRTVRAAAQRSTQHSPLPGSPSWRGAPDDFCDIPRQVHSLLKKGLNDNVRDVCTTEQSLNSLKKPNGSFNRQAIISSQTTEVRNTALSPPGFGERAHGNLNHRQHFKTPYFRSIAFPPSPQKRLWRSISF